MTLAENLSFLRFAAVVATNVMVAFYVLPVWKERRIGGLAFIGVSALTGVYLAVADRMWERSQQTAAVYYWFWCSWHIVAIADAICWAIGVVLLLRHLAPPTAK